MLIPIICLSTFILFFMYSSLDSYYETTRKQYGVVKTNDGVRYVLFWSDMLGDKNFHFSKQGRELFEKCKINNCFATSNKNLLPIDEFDALMFYVPTKKEYRNYPIPNKRGVSQRYIFVNAETPIRFHGKMVRFLYDDFFNWTMTYRFDSDIIRRHGYVYKRNVPNDSYVLPNFANKRSVAWVVSNCNTPSKREVLVEKLKQFIDVDVYGKCGNETCPKFEDCFDMIERKYKFYLSFENSYCKDYTTEKLYRNLNKNIIPVVYGGGNYDEITPPHSIIDVKNYESVEDLANYLNHLAKNENEYLKYFEWKKQYYVSFSNSETVCNLCAKLNNPNEPAKSYSDIRSWWYSFTCKIGHDLPKIISSLL